MGSIMYNIYTSFTPVTYHIDLRFLGVVRVEASRFTMKDLLFRQCFIMKCKSKLPHTDVFSCGFNTKLRTYGWPKSLSPRHKIIFNASMNKI